MRSTFLLTIVVALICVAYAYPTEDRFEDDGAYSGDIAETLTVELEPQGHENAGPRIARQFGGFGGFGGFGNRYGGYGGGHHHHHHGGFGNYGHGGYGHGGFGHGGFGGHGHGHGHYYG